MKHIPRRRFLGAISLTGALGGAGCSLRGQGETTPSGTATATLDVLSYSAEVVEQESADTPATIRATLANRGERPCRIWTGDTIVPRYEAGPDDDLLLFPGTNVGPNDRPDEPIDGCWRYTDGDFLTRDIVERRDLAPGDSLEETYGILTRGEARPCLPAGEYEFVDTIQRPPAGDGLAVRVRVSTSDGHVAVQGSVERT